MTQLPNGWTLTSIADIATFNPKTIADDSLNCAFAPMQYLGTRFLAQMNYEQRTWGEIKKSYVHFQTGDVIVAKVTPCFENGKAGIAPHLPNGIGAGSSEFCVFRPAQGIDKRYLLAWLSTENFRKRATVAMTGSVGLKRVPKEVFLSEEIPLAPEAEQRRIADKLDTTLARVDALNDRLARITPLLKRFRQSVLAAATSGRLTEDWVLQYSLPEAHQCTLKEVIKVSSGDGLTAKNMNSDGGIPVFGGNGINGYHDQHNVNESTIVIGRVGYYCGSVHLTPEKAWVTDNALKVAYDKQYINKKFLYYSLLGNDLRKNVSSTAQPVISGQKIYSLPFRLPVIEEQTEIVRRVETLFAFADRLEARLQSAQTAAERLTPALLAKAFRGELVPQDPNDEPAAELLRRLREARAADTASKPKRGRAAKAPTVSE